MSVYAIASSFADSLTIVTYHLGLMEYNRCLNHLHLINRITTISSQMISNLFLIAVIVVIIVDLSGFIDTLKH